MSDENQTETVAAGPADAPVPATPTPVAPARSATEQVALNRNIATIDGSVTQGNRVTTARAITPEDPLNVAYAKIAEHFDNATHIVSDLHAIATEREGLLNRLRVGC